MWRALQNNNDRLMEGRLGGSLLSSGEKPEGSAGSPKPNISSGRGTVFRYPTLIRYQKKKDNNIPELCLKNP
ncbi:hypothetical protein EYF80_001343 [Liparis tanakae]|uniref:Uncharacterized protein n=1 Tax=Liparis tanakae TaxID=230148 RepID=A0A4Z2JEF1_9TELE|nr:hypothetical protein EYF80_001343 [Liparis tanakae]